MSKIQHMEVFICFKWKVTEIYSKLFLRFQLWRVSFFPRDPRIGSSSREFQIIKGSRNRGGGGFTVLEWSKSM